MQKAENKIKIICEFEKEKAEWDSMSEEDKEERQLTANELKEHWPEIVTGDTLGYWQVVGMNNSGL
uniref:hypothetical protein n=1 Tax=Anaerococcus mediterraneensis TaxID=1870984 RepID=UPI00092FE9F3|nr:hypothetical protein [Anaerococcus mediterraneensis]